MSTALRALVAKDLRLFFADRRALVITLVVPIALAALMGAVFGGSGDVEDASIRVAVVDLDDSEISRDVVARLGAESALELTALPLDEARERVRKGKTAVAVVIPAGFDAAARRTFFGGGEKPVVSIPYDPTEGAARAMVEGILTEKVMQVVSTRMFSAPTVTDLLKQVQGDPSLAGAERQALATLLGSVLDWQMVTAATGSGAGGGLQLPYATQAEAVTGGATRYNAYSHSFAGMGVQFVLFAGIDAACALLAERRRGLWRRFRAAPVARRTFLVARMISGALVAFGIFAALMLTGTLFFAVRVHGSALGLMLVVAAFSLLCSTFGLFVAAVGRTEKAARGVAIFAVLVLVMLGGAWFPSFVFPPFMQTLTLVTPTRWAVDALDAMTWRGLGLEAALPAVGVLLAFAVGLGALAVWRFRWDADV